MITATYDYFRIMLAIFFWICYKIFMTNTLSSYDELIHLVCERGMQGKELQDEVIKLFPLHSFDESHYTAEEFFSETKIEMYAYSRSLGMSEMDAAHSIGLSSKIIEKALQGEGVSLRTLVSLAKSELMVIAEIKLKHLKNLEVSDGPGASLTFLQTIYPKQYRKDALLSNVTVTNVIDDPEALLKAKGIPLPEIIIDDLPDFDSSDEPLPDEGEDEP